MSAFTEFALAETRAEFALDLPDTASVYTITKAQNSDGEVETATLRETAEPCRYATLTGRELERAQQVAAEADSIVTFEANFAVSSTDRLVVTDAETGEINPVEVLHVIKRSREFQRRVLCKDLSA